MATAVIYARVSRESDRQNTERQVEDLKRYIAINDMELVATYEEKMSGAKENRPVLTECIGFASRTTLTHYAFQKSAVWVARQRLL